MSYHVNEAVKARFIQSPIVGNGYFNYCFNPFALAWQQSAWYKIWIEEQEKHFRSWLATEKRLLLYMLQWGFPTGPYWEKPIDIRIC